MSDPCTLLRLVGHITRHPVDALHRSIGRAYYSRALIDPAHVASGQDRAVFDVECLARPQAFPSGFQARPILGVCEFYPERWLRHEVFSSPAEKALGRWTRKEEAFAARIGRPGHVLQRIQDARQPLARHIELDPDTPLLAPLAGLANSPLNRGRQPKKVCFQD